MSLLVVGLSHRTAPVSVLERAALGEDTKGKLLLDVMAAEPAGEAAVLSTCNRIELYADVDKFHAGVAELSTLLARHSGVGLDELTPHLYVHYEDRAVHHLFSVACGLDSMVVGEGQILGQIKETLGLGQELHTAGRSLNDLFQQALRVGKRAHSETGIDRAGQSLVTFGLEQMAEAVGGVPFEEWGKGKRALVVGAGSMSSLAAATLARAGAGEIVVVNRTQERAERLAESVGGRAASMADLAGELSYADIVVSCTGATGLVLTADTVARATLSGPCAPAASPSRPSGCSTSHCRATSTRWCTPWTAPTSPTWRPSPRPPPTPRWPPTSTRCERSFPLRWPPSAPPSVPRTSRRPSSPCAPWPPTWSPPSWRASTAASPTWTNGSARRSPRPCAASSTNSCTRLLCGSSSSRASPAVPGTPTRCVNSSTWTPRRSPRSAGPTHRARR